jgi:hypothetical protein
MGKAKKPLSDEDLLQDFTEWTIELYECDGGQFMGGAMMNAYEATKAEILRRMAK